MSDTVEQRPLDRPVRRLQFPAHGTAIMQAIAEVYKELGLEMEQVTPHKKQYPTDHWNIGGMMYNAAINSQHGNCSECRFPVNYHTVIRCLDCRAALCESCATKHFGAGHAGRAAAAHDA